MKKGQEIIVEYPGVLLLHQKEPGKELAHHSHNEHEIFIPIQGEINVNTEDDSIGASPGRMLYMPPHTEHSFSSSSSGEGERVIILIKDKYWKKSSTKDFKAKSLPLNSFVRELVFYLLLNTNSKYFKSFTASLIDSLIEQLEFCEKINFETIEHLGSKISDPRIKKAYNYIVKNGDTTAKELAQVSGLSTRNLNRLFLSEVGSTPKQFAIALKIERAKILLKTTNKTITDISLEIGYNSLSKFISTFQKVVGVLPSDYRSTF